MTLPVTVSIVSHDQMVIILPLLEQLSLFSSSVIDKVVLTFNTPERDLTLTGDWKFPIQRIYNAAPKGFGENHNQAFENCNTPWFLVLNPDIRLQSDVLTPLISQAHEHSGLLAPRIFEPEKQLPEAHRGLVTPWEIVARHQAAYVAPQRPAWIPGLFMLFKHAAYAEIGGFDDKRFFMYGEDVDISARIVLAGWQLQIAEDLSACHEAQRASHAKAKHLYWHIKSLLAIWSSPVFWKYRALLRSAPSGAASRQI